MLCADFHAGPSSNILLVLYEKVKPHNHGDITTSLSVNFPKCTSLAFMLPRWVCPADSPRNVNFKMATEGKTAVSFSFSKKETKKGPGVGKNALESEAASETKAAEKDFIHSAEGRELKR